MSKTTLADKFNTRKLIRSTINKKRKISSNTYKSFSELKFDW